MKNKKLRLGLSILSFMFIAITSCEKNEDNPAYVGTWIHQASMDFYGGGVLVPIQIKMKLTKTTFEWSFGVEAENQVVDLGTVKGDLSATDTEFTLIPTNVGMVNQEGEYDWISKGEPGWNEALAGWEMQETMTSEYSISGNTLTMDIDGEPMSFTRQ